MKIEITLDPSKDLAAQLRPIVDMLWYGAQPKVTMTDELRAKLDSIRVDVNQNPVDEPGEAGGFPHVPDDASEETPEEAPKKRGRKPKADKPIPPIVKQPEPLPVPEVSEADEEQDDEDEIAETAVPDEPRVYTVDDVRYAMTQYVNAFGYLAANEDGVKILTALFPGKDYRKVSQIPAEDYERTAKAFLDAVEANPFNRSPQ